MPTELPSSDPRAKRYYLAPSDYGLHEGPPYVPAGVVDIGIWKSVVLSPESVLLETTDYRPAEIKAAYEMHTRLLDCAEALEQDERGSGPLHLQILSSYEDLSSSLYNAVVGWYRTAGLCLRTALDDILLGLYYGQPSGNLVEFDEVVSGRKRSLAVRYMLRNIQAQSGDAAFDPQTGSFIVLYDTLSAYQHRKSNFEIVQSNAPIFDEPAFSTWNHEFAEVCDLIISKAC